MKPLHQQLLKYHDLTKKQRWFIFQSFSKCLICKGKSKSERLVIDHCHTSGYCRGVLCEKCNSILGVLESKRSNEQKKTYIEKVSRKYKIATNHFYSYLKRTKFYTVDTLTDGAFRPWFVVYL